MNFSPLSFSPVGEMQVTLHSYFRCGLTPFSRSNQFLPFGKVRKGCPLWKVRRVVPWGRLGWVCGYDGSAVRCG